MTKEEREDAIYRLKHTVTYTEGAGKAIQNAIRALSIDYDAIIAEIEAEMYTEEEISDLCDIEYNAGCRCGIEIIREHIERAKQ